MLFSILNRRLYPSAKSTFRTHLTITFKALLSSHRVNPQTARPSSKMAPINYAVCSIIPPHMLIGLANCTEAHQDSRDAANDSLLQTDEIRAQRYPSLQHAHHGPPGAQGIIPPHITSHIAHHGEDQGIRAAAEDTSQFDEGIRAARTKGGAAGSSTTINRKIYTCRGGTRLPGTLIRSEGQKEIGIRDKTNDPDECYDGFGATYDFYKTILGRNSIDDKGLPLSVLFITAAGTATPCGMASR